MDGSRHGGRSGRRQVAVIFASLARQRSPPRRRTKTIPIVFASAEIRPNGLVASMNRPGAHHGRDLLHERARDPSGSSLAELVPQAATIASGGRYTNNRNGYQRHAGGGA